MSLLPSNLVLLYKGNARLSAPSPSPPILARDTVFTTFQTGLQQLVFVCVV
jgi:hypothetical protein